MASSPRAKERFEHDKQLGCFPRSEDVLREAPRTSKRRGDGEFLKKSKKDVLDDKEKDLLEIRNYWQEEYKNKSNEVGQLEIALKQAIESRNIEVKEMRMSHESELNARNSEIAELRRTLDELTETKEDILASVEKSTESKLRAKDEEITRLRIWLEEAKKSNAQGREVLSSYQRRVADKETEIELLKRSNEEETKLLEQKIDKLQGLLSEVIADKNKDSENTMAVFNSVVEEKERQIAMLKESSENTLITKEEENKRKDMQIEELSDKLIWVEAQLTNEWLDSEIDEDLKTKTTSLLKQMSNLKAEKCFLEKDMAALVVDTRAKETKLCDMQAKFESESHNKKRLQQEFDTLTHDLESWKSAMNLIEEDRNSLEKDVKCLRDDLERKNNCMCELECKVRSLESVRQNLEELIRQLREENSEYLQAQKNVEFAIREKDREQFLLKEKLSISEKKIGLEIEQKAIMEENNTAIIQNLRNKEEKLEKENQDLKINLEERENDVGSLTRLLEDAKQQENKLEAELVQLSEELELLHEKYACEKSQKEALERSLTGAIASKEQEIEELQQKLEKTVFEQKCEVEKREGCWKEAMKVKDDVIKDTRTSFEERIMWKEDEAKKLERGLKEKDEKIAEITAAYRDVLQKTGELEKEFKDCQTNLDEANQTKLTNAEKEIESLRAQLKQQEDNCVAEITTILHSTEKGFKERENVGEKLKAIIQENAVKYHQSLQRKDDKISALKKELENSNKDNDDMRANLAAFIQESGDNELKLNRDLKIMEDECRSLENKVFELKKSLENRDKELEIMESNMVNAVSEFEKKQKLKEQEMETITAELCCEQAKVQELRGIFREIEDLLKVPQSEKVSAKEVKQKLLQEFEKQRRSIDEKDGKIAVLIHKVKILKKNHFETAKKHEQLEEKLVTLQLKLNERDTEMIELKKEKETKEAEFYERSLLIEEMELKQDEEEKIITELQETISVQKAEIEEAVTREEELKGAVQNLLTSLKDSEFNNRALVSQIKDGKSENEKILSEFENLKASSLKDKSDLTEEVDHLHGELDNQEGLLLTLNKEKESLLAALEKTKQDEEKKRTVMDCRIKFLKKENVRLEERLTSLDEELKLRLAEIAEINSALASVEVSKEFLTREVENLKILVTDKEDSLCVARKSLEAEQKENGRLKYETKSLENNLARVANEKDCLVKSFEEFKDSSFLVKQKFEDVLSDKEKTIIGAESLIRQLKQDSGTLKSQLYKRERELETDKKCVVDLLEKQREMSEEIESLNKDKNILEASLKDMDLYSVKLKTTQGRSIYHMYFWLQH